MDKDICKRCGRPKTSKKSGSITQFVALCVCDLPDIDEGANTLKICTDCGKRIRLEMDGSITQFIFKDNYCSCKMPKPKAVKKNVYKSRAFEGFLEEGADENYLDLDPDKFPVERYKPIKLLGKGTVGDVYLTRDTLLNKKVTVKTLFVLDSEQLIQFQKEAKVTSKLHHPNIVTIIDFGATEAGAPYMVMEYFPGVSLEEVIKERGPLEWKVARNITMLIASALEYSHKRGVFHRDLKPSNILISLDDESDAEIRLIDFGIAKFIEMTLQSIERQDDTLAGTPAYMSPDVSLGNSYDATSEVYSVGCILYEILTGKPPFVADTAMETLSLHVNKEPRKISEVSSVFVPSYAERIITKCLEKEQSNRYQSMAEFSEALMSADRRRLGMTIQAASQSIFQRDRKREFKTGTSIDTVYTTSLVFTAGCLLVTAGIFVGSLVMNSVDESHKYNQLKADPKLRFYLEKLSSDRIEEKVQARAEIHDVVLYKCTFSDRSKCFQLLGCITKLNSLTIEESTLSDSDLRVFRKELSRRPDKGKLFKSLSLPGAQLNSELLEEICKLTMLEKLVLSYTNIRDQDIPTLKKLPELKYLDLSFCKNITSNSVPDLKALELKEINIRESKIDSPGIIRLCEDSAIKRVILSIFQEDPNGRLNRLYPLIKFDFVD